MSNQRLQKEAQIAYVFAKHRWAYANIEGIVDKMVPNDNSWMLTPTNGLPSEVAILRKKKLALAKGFLLIAFGIILDDIMIY